MYLLHCPNIKLSSGHTDGEWPCCGTFDLRLLTERIVWGSGHVVDQREEVRAMHLSFSLPMVLRPFAWGYSLRFGIQINRFSKIDFISRS